MNSDKLSYTLSDVPELATSMLHVCDATIQCAHTLPKTIRAVCARHRT